MFTERLIIELDAKTGKLDATLKATDKNLDNLDKSTQKADKSLSTLTATASTVAAGVAGVAAGVGVLAAAFSSAALSASQYAREIKIAAQLSGETAEKIQLISHATATVGIGMEQLGDISKDTLEKIGDYLNTGGGGFMDYVDAMKLTEEQAIATANEFKSMSGPQVLQEMVKRMEDANVSAVQMSHALEGMASETTRLIPLLENGGKKLAGLVDTAASLTIPLSKEDIEKFDELKISSDNASAALKSLGQQTLLDLSDMFIRVADNASKFIAMLNKGTEEYNNKRLEEIREELNEIGHAAENARSPLGRIANALTFSTYQENFAHERINALLKERESLYAANEKARESSNLEVPTVSGMAVPEGDGDGGITSPVSIEKKNEAALSLIADRFKTEEELLAQKFAKEYALAADNEQLRADLVKEFDENVAAAKLEAEEAYMQASSDLYWTKIEEQNQERFDAEIEEQQRLLGEKLINEESYLKSVNDLAIKYGKVGVKDKKKENKDKEKSDVDYTEAALGASTALFSNNKSIKSANVVVDSAAGIQKAFADLPYPAAIGASVQIAASGIAQLAAINSASPGSGGSSPTSSASSSPTSSGGGFSSSVEVNETVGSGANTSTTSNVITFSGSSSDTVGMAMAEWFNNALASGEIKLGR